MDLEGALQRMGGDRELLVMLMRMFLADAPSLVQNIEAGSESDQGERVHSAAHSLRGIAANLGAEEVMRAASEVEARAAATPEERRAAVQALRSAVERAIGELRQELG